MFDSYAEIFSERADMYHRAMAAFPEARRREFEAMVSPLPAASNGRLCDMPSGGGYLAAYLPSSWRCTAVEPTETFAALCTLRDGDDLIQCPLTSVPRPDASFDAVISLAGLHHEHDKLAILQEMARLLRPGAKAVIADVAAESNEDRFLNGFVDRHSKLGHRGEFLDDGFASLARQSGLQIDSDERIATPWQFSSRAEAAVFATDLFGISAPLDAVVDALESTIGFDLADGRASLAWKLRRLVCTRPDGSFE